MSVLLCSVQTVQRTGLYICSWEMGPPSPTPLQRLGVWDFLQVSWALPRSTDPSYFCLTGWIHIVFLLMALAYPTALPLRTALHHKNKQNRNKHIHTENKSMVARQEGFEVKKVKGIPKYKLPALWSRGCKIQHRKYSQ